MSDLIIEKISVGEGTGGPNGFDVMYGHNMFDTGAHDLSGIRITTLSISSLYDYMKK